MLTAFRAAFMLFLLAKRDGEDAIFSNRGSIFIFLLVPLFKSSEDGLETLSVGDDFISGVVFKILVALIDTPLLYLSVNWIRLYYKLEINEEIKL